MITISKLKINLVEDAIFFEGFIQPVGACGFYFSKEQQHWGLHWVWIHPFARRHGHLARAWDYFCQHYHDFEVIEPLSHAMAASLKKQGKLQN